jgi:transcriptional regulator with XRE-family HTH domain
MGNNLKFLRVSRKWTHDQAADAMGLSRSQFIKLERGERRMTERTIRAAAKAFNVSESDVLSSILEARANGIPSVRLDPSGPANDDDRLTLVNDPTVEAAHGGAVRAGSFRPVDEYQDDAPLPVVIFRDREFPDIPMVVFDVEGDSMNDLKPRPILNGDRLECLDFNALQGRLVLRDGLVVVVEQWRDGGQLRERSVKQVELYEDRIEFHPRSTNARHKPIVVPRQLARDPSEEDDRRVEVLAVVRRIVNEVPST